MSWVVTILGIVLLIVLHELGHFAVAKAVGMRVERFSLFFPPKLFGFKRGETEYVVGAIPAGGYVKITGMNPEELGQLDPEAARRAYYAQPPWKRVAVIVAGPLVNLLIAFFLFTGVLLSGNLNGAETLANLHPSTQTVQSTDTVHEVERGQPAASALRAGDRIVAIEGHKAGGAEQVRQAIASHRCAGAQVDGCRATSPVRLTVLRDGRPVVLSVLPRYNAALARMELGFEFGLRAKNFGVFSAAGVAVDEMWGVTTQTITSIGHAFTSEKVRKEFHSIVGITQIAHETVAAGAGYALVFLGFISLILAVLNMFPFLPLDGGHVLWAVAEKVRGRRISLASMYRFSSVGIILLVFLVLNGLSNDISRLAG
jgi:regulator of sigma E protease